MRVCVQITITANGRNVVTSTAGPGGVEPLVNIVDVVNDLSARGHTLKAGLDEGLLSFSFSNLLYMENPYSYNTCQ